ncbi:unnamed protein product [Clonostachys rosea f. rosea IK726]|uniref:Uncharacterized protein n=1 Tax=Clonostachys rosea f. rosea IK726 TaxID=1349383 RepID=A0ACA9URS6_BIOOC|nr:unnamed protein product [Clonostachys rosea f. rosea IK726]
MVYAGKLEIAPIRSHAVARWNKGLAARSSLYVQPATACTSLAESLEVATFGAAHPLGRLKPARNVVIEQKPAVIGRTAKLFRNPLGFAQTREFRLPIDSFFLFFPPHSFTIPPLAGPGNPSSVPDPDPGTATIHGHCERGGDRKQRSIDDPPLVALDGDAEQFELADYSDIAARQADEKRRERQEEKRAQKRAWLEEQDEMKFSHSIQFNAVPDWSSHYIAYSNLKKLIYQLEKTYHHTRAGDAESRPLIPSEDPEEIFSKALGIELEKICSFYVGKEGELLEEVNQLLRDISNSGAADGLAPLRPFTSNEGQREPRRLSSSFGISEDEIEEDSASEDDERTGLTRARKGSVGRRPNLGSSAHSLGDMAASSEFGRSVRRQSTTFDEGEQSMYFSSELYSSAIVIKKRIISLYVQLCELKSFTQLNNTGFRKVLKKFDKILDKELKTSYMHTNVDTAYPFKEETRRVLEENIAKMETAYTDVVTGGDRELAKKDLRSHLREHVVWERNTVWRDLIGIERRGEAARLGQSLLGHDPNATRTRLQGDDLHEISHKGRFNLPAWLVNTSMLTLFICVGIFFALLYVPIMQKPEQQNCLALLVFVSLLWATETIPLFVTSLLIPFLSVLLNVVRDEGSGKHHHRLNSKDATTAIFAAMWTPVIMLLLGGFTLAAALSKCKIDKRLATLILSKAGTQPRTVLIANMFVAAFASMLISNVAAPVLCYSIIEPMLRTLPSDSDMTKALIIGIALASNVGGMLSPIASPQNVIAMGIMQPPPTWIQWFFIVIPVGAISLVLIWLLLLITFRPGRGISIAPIRAVKEQFTGVQWFVSFVTFATIALWCASHQLENVFGDMGVIAIIPIVLFFGIGILTKEDFNNFPWTIIILAAGGLSLGKAVRSSGLLHTVAGIVTAKVEGMSLYGVLVVFSTLILVIATFISHTVAAVIFLPLVYDVGAAMELPHPNLLVMAGVLMCSAAMGLPTSGFPNMTAIMKEDPAGHRYLQVKHFISRGVPSSFITLAVVVSLGYGIMQLAAFTARPIIELRQRDKSKIETILANGDRVLVGLNSGTLRIYRLNEPPPTTNGSHPPANDGGSQNGGEAHSSAPVKPTDLLREVEKFSSRAIEQLAIIKEANIIISLSNYHISFHDLQTYELVETLGRTKNASCFAVTSNIVKDPDTGIPEIISRLAVAVKRRLLLWSWHESELSDHVGEVTLSDTIRSVTWANATKLVCGMNSGYVMVDVLTREVVDIISPGTLAANGQGSRFGAVSSAGMGYMGLGGYMPRPLAAKLADGEMLLAKDINSMFIDDKGQPIEKKKQVPWQAAPESVGYSYPYILALQPPSKGSLEVRNPDTLSLLQTISLPGAAQLHFLPPTVSLAHAKGFHISSERCVWKLGATDYDTQVQELVTGSLFDEAISLLNMLEDALLQDKVGTLREVKMMKAERLFKDKKYEKSLDLFNEDDVHAPPERVLKLYPPEISGELSVWHGHSQEEEEEGGETENAAPEKTNGDSPAAESPDPSSPQAVGGFAKLFGSRRGIPADAASIASSRRESKDAEDTDDANNSVKAEDGPLHGKDLTNAVKALNSYLAGTRARLQRLIDPATGKLKPASKTSTGTEIDVEEFLRLSQTDDEKKQEAELQKTFRIVDTALFRAYMFSSPTLAGSLFRLPNFCDPDVVNEKLLEHSRYNELIDFFKGKKLHKEALDLLKKFGTATKPDPAAPTLHGPDRAIWYLEGLPPSEIDLILEHAKWVLEENPEYAMEIFTGDTENAETLPRDKVLAFLREQGPQLEAQYLAHVIEEMGDMTPDFHNRLVELYVQNLAKKARGEDWDKEMERFMKFLRESRQVYSLTKAFGLIPRDDPAFYEARAIVLSNMGQHKQALEIYVDSMQDYAKAEDYCNRIHLSQEAAAVEDGVDGSSSNDDDLSIYHTLLSIYLKPAPPQKPKLAPALDLLSKHGSRLPAASTLGLIPNDLPVGELESYFRGRMRAANSLVNESRIVAKLREAEGISIAARLYLGDETEDGQGGRHRHVVITDEKLCVVCHRRFGGGMRTGGSVVAVLPDNTVVHYGCLSKATGQRTERAQAPSWGRGF